MAAIERDGAAVILPAPPGSGKSTLCAGLIHSGWLLLSDELTLIHMRDGLIWPLCRPVSLKNQSIAVMRRFAPQAVFGRVTHETTKGSVTHMKVPTPHLLQVDVPVRARWIVYPKFEKEAQTDMKPRARGSALVDLARNAFNFSLQGEAGFDRLCSVVQGCDSVDFRSSNLHQAVVAFDQFGALVPAELRAAFNRLRPAWLPRVLMAKLLLIALRPAHSSCQSPGEGLARWLLYVRSHWLRMPLRLLIPHLLRKAWMSRFPDKAVR